MERFDIWPYHSAMNSSELPYHIFTIFQRNKLTFSSFWEQIADLRHHFTKRGE